MRSENNIEFTCRCLDNFDIFFLLWCDRHNHFFWCFLLRRGFQFILLLLFWWRFFVRLNDFGCFSSSSTTTTTTSRPSSIRCKWNKNVFNEIVSSKCFLANLACRVHGLFHVWLSFHLNPFSAPEPISPVLVFVLIVASKITYKNTIQMVIIENKQNIKSKCRLDKYHSPANANWNVKTVNFTLTEFFVVAVALMLILWVLSLFV